MREDEAVVVSSKVVSSETLKPSDAASPTRAPAAMRLLRRLGVAALTLAGVGALATPADAQSYSQFVREANRNTVSLVSGPPGSTSLEIAHDLATVLHCVDGIRIIPIAGRGDQNNIYDLLFLKGVDMAIVRADVLDHIRDSQTYIRDLRERVRYIAPLFEQEVHLIANEDIQTIEDLQGKLVNVGGPGQLALEATRVLEAAGVTVIESKFDDTLALERVIDGGLDAMFITGGKPIPLLSQLGMVSGLHLVPIPPLDDAVYNTASFDQSDYPALVSAGESVQTISVPSVLAVYNWPTDNARYEKNAVFTRAFFRRASYLNRPARHPKWANAELADSVSGWVRFDIAEQIAATIRPAVAASAPVAAAPSGPSTEAIEAAFAQQLEEFGITPRSDKEREQLFMAFKRRMEAQRR